MLETSRNLNQWFAHAGKLCGGTWCYQGDQGTRAHQLMTRLCDTQTHITEGVSLVWQDGDITSQKLEKLWKKAPTGAIIAGDGYGVLEANSVSRTVHEFAEKHGIEHYHNRTHPAQWWIIKETANESMAHSEDAGDTASTGESTLSGSASSRDV